MFLLRMGRRLLAGSERILFLLALVSILPMLSYLPTPANKERLLAEEFDEACAPHRNKEYALASTTIAAFLELHPGSVHEGQARMRLADVWFHRAQAERSRAGEYFRIATDQAGLAQKSGVPPAEVLDLRLRAVDALLAGDEVDRGIEVLEEILAEDALPVERLLQLARAYSRTSPPRFDRARERLEMYASRAAQDPAAQVRALLYRSDIEFAGQHAKEAVAHLDEALQRYPTGEHVAEVRLALGRILFRSGDHAAALERLRPLVEGAGNDQDRAEAEFWYGRADLAESRLQEAIARFQGLLEKRPPAALGFAIRVFLGSAYRSLRELRTAYAYFDDAVRDLPSVHLEDTGHIDFREFATECRLLAELSESREFLAFGVRLNRAAAEALPESMRALFHELHASAAERLSKRIREEEESATAGRTPEERAAARQRARELLIEAADAHWARAQLPASGAPPGHAYFHAGVDLHDAGFALRAVRAFQAYLHECLFEDPFQPRALYLLGVTYQDLGEYDKALDAHRRNLFQFSDVFPDAYSSRREMGACYEAKGDWTAAQLAYEDVLKSQDLSWTHPVWRASLARLGEVGYRLHLRAEARGEKAAASEELRKAIQRLDEFWRRYPDANEELVPVLRTLGICALRARDGKRAVAALTRAVEIGLGTGRPPDAVAPADEPQAAIREASLLLADALFLQGDVDRALAHYSDYRLRFASGRSELWVLRQMERCQQLRGDVREAARYRELRELARKRLAPAEGEKDFTMEFWDQWTGPN